jgi:adenylate cyclase
MRRFERQLRLATGLIIATFVVLHLLNHSLGVVSVDAMDRMRGVLVRFWWTPLGGILLYGALVTHFLLALVSLYRRTTLRMPAWEAAQLLLGLAVPPLLIGHIVGTRVTHELFEHTITYVRVISVLWSDPSLAAQQALLLLIVWGHLCFGIHFWLRLQRWYPRAQPLLFALALLVPALALAGFAAAGFALAPTVERMGGPAKIVPELGTLNASDRALLTAWRESLLLAFWFALGATLLARLLRPRLGASYQVRHSSGRVISAPIGRSVLEALRDAGVPHASVCGGRARCTTCRVRVGAGLAALAPPASLEAEALRRIDAEPNVRLACQTRPTEDLAVTPLLPADAGAADARRPGGVQGRERSIVAMFVDLRGSTRLAEGRLPYDVVFVMNQFFAEMFDALRRTGGYYAQFRGDGLLALYGLDEELGAGCRHAFEGAAEMQRRIDWLNERLANELPEPLRIGIGMHAGEAIVGTMGPPDAPIYSAIGDNVNIAARFEGMTKAYRCVLVVSSETIRRAGLAAPAEGLHQVRVRGRTERVEVYAIEDPRTLVAPGREARPARA